MNEGRRILDLTVTEDCWMTCDAEGSHLTAVLVINGTFHHLEAIRVVEDEDGIQQSASSEHEATFTAMCEIGGDGPFDTVNLRGREYVLALVPF